MLLADEKTIDEQVNAKDTRLVLFFADWCPYCRKFKPVFESYEKKSGVKLVEAMVNEDENPMWDRFKINIVPTMVAFKDGKQLARKDGIPAWGLTEKDLDSLLQKITS